jgi:sulfur carrier protein ThiS
VKINIKLVAHSGSPIPGIGPDGEGSLEVSDGATVADVLGQLDVAKEKLTMALVNEAVVRPAIHHEHCLNDGDLVTVFPPIEGG